MHFFEGQTVQDWHRGVPSRHVKGNNSVTVAGLTQADGKAFRYGENCSAMATALRRAEALLTVS